MKKFILSLICLLILVANANAYDAIIDGMYFNLNEETLTATITHKGGQYGYSDGMNSYSGPEVIVPATITFKGKTYDVTSVNSYTFYRCQNLTKVVLPESVRSIGAYAFFDSPILTDITIPNNIETIGAGAFENTPWIDNFPDGCIYIGTILYKYKGEIPNDANIEVKEGTTTITSFAFDAAREISCLNIKSVTLPSSLKIIGDEAFYMCSAMEKINIPKDVIYLGDGCFHHCYKLDSIILPEGLEYIGHNAFKECTHLTEIVIPNSVKTLGAGCFNRCGLISAIIGDGVEEILSNTFTCRYLTTVKLGKSIKKIESHAFNTVMSKESLISTLVIDAEIAPTAPHDALDLHPNCEIQVPCGSGSSYKALTLPYDNYNVTENTYSLNIYTNYLIDDFIIERLALGHILYHKMPSCDDNVANIEAVPNFNSYEFVKWSDECTDNPRTIELHQDTMLYAIFKEKNSDVTINNLNEQALKIYTKNNTLFIEENEMYFRIMTTDGKTIYSGKEQQIVLPNGLYFIIFENGYTYKFAL